MRSYRLEVGHGCRGLDSTEPRAGQSTNMHEYLRHSEAQDYNVITREKCEFLDATESRRYPRDNKGATSPIDLLGQTSLNCGGGRFWVHGGASL
jgi:hypothetical protein